MVPAAGAGEIDGSRPCSAQAQGWKIFSALEPGPNATSLYVFVIDPAVPGADYGLGRILADAYPEQIQEIWKLYTGSVTGGGTHREPQRRRADAAGACRARARARHDAGTRHAHPAAASGDAFA